MAAFFARWGKNYARPYQPDQYPVEVGPVLHKPRGSPRLRLRRLLPGEMATSLVSRLLEGEINVLLTLTWITQAQKARSQKRFMAVERDTLWPMVKGLMADFLSVLDYEEGRIWAETALALLNEEKGSGAVAGRVEAVLQDPAAIPRGHYEEGMHGYFRGVQFLFKSVFDVELNRLWCKLISHFVFPWSALGPILETLRANPDLRQRWDDLHHFYTVATGEPDCMCFHDLLDEPEVHKETVAALAREMDLPKVNRKMGLGVQALAERFTRHGVIFERLKETFLPDVTREPIPRDSVYAVVNMHSLLYGFEHPINGQCLPRLLDGKVEGLLEALATVRGRPAASFFDQFLLAQYELVADLPVPEVNYLDPRLDPAVERLDPFLRRLNAFAANLTSLLEISILSVKQPMKVVIRGARPLPSAPPQARIYVEKAPRVFFKQMHQAARTVAELCARMAQKYGVHPKGPPVRLLPVDLAAVYQLLADLSARGRFVLSTSAEWHTLAPLLEKLERDPNVTADAYRHWDVDPNERYFLQWCTAMAAFEAQMPDGTSVEGGELLFVEGWNDALVPGRKEALTNSVWRDVLSQMALADLKERTIAPGL
jgi:hypothetical protein